ncbi:hypothetical protein B0H11DRAFT_2424782 [Mycena galericulata]|nr:hypothetical protein B0H11DRAFT_2424782 [Mycena galericulata]
MRATIRVCEASFILASGGAFLIPRAIFTCAHEISVADANDGRTNGAIFDFEDSSDATLPSPVITLGRVAGLAAVNLVVFVTVSPTYQVIISRDQPSLASETHCQEVQSIAGDINEIVGNLPPEGMLCQLPGFTASWLRHLPVQTRWFRFKPGSRSSKHNENFTPVSSPAKPKKRKSSEKQKSRTNESSDVEIVGTPPKRKKKKSVPTEERDEDEDSVEMTVYLYVQASPPPLVQVRRNTAAKAPAPKITPVGPFLFQSSLSYADFSAMLAKGCRTKANHLPVNSMEWKFDCPTNSAKKPLSNADGYTAMIKTVKDRRKDFVFSVYMPPPSVVKSELNHLNLMPSFLRPATLPGPSHPEHC